MQKFSPWAYIRKFQILIVAVTLAAGVFSYKFFSGRQEYTVSAIIEYTNERAKEGFSPDGAEIDTSEIYSASVMQDVFGRMGLDYSTNNLDDLRSRIVVRPILTEEQKAVQDAQNETGEESTVKATRYQVSFSANRDDSDQPANFARQLMDNLLDAFLADYAEQHIGGGTISGNLSGIDNGNYDYLEMIEIMEEGVNNTLQTLQGRVNALQGSPLYFYRSAQTGYTFMDLYREFDLVSQIDIPNIYAQILKNRASRDKDVLISKYRKRIEDYEIDGTVNSSNTEAITQVISAYVNMMRESGNTNFTSEYIIDGIENSNWYVQQQGDAEGTGVVREPADETVKYDALLQEYVQNRTNWEYNELNKAYCEYVIGVFSETEGEAAADVNAETEGMLEEAVARLNELYRLLSRTMDEYNEYAGAANISLDSNVVLQAGMMLELYSGIVMIACAVLMSIAIVAIGRLADIFGRYLYIDPKFNIPNRVACDRYIDRCSKRLLPEGFSCVAVVADRVRQKNERYGVQACDEMLKSLIAILQAAFARVDDCFLSVNGLGQFVLFAKSTADPLEACMRYVERAAAEYNEGKECRISYQYGIAESRRDSIYQIKELLVQAMGKCAGSGSAAQAAPDSAKKAGGRKDRTGNRSPAAGASARRGEPADGSGKPAPNAADGLDDLLERLKKARSAE